jgi:hypothetical protein
MAFTGPREAIQDIRELHEIYSDAVVRQDLEVAGRAVTGLPDTRAHRRRCASATLRCGRKHGVEQLE